MQEKLFTTADKYKELRKQKDELQFQLKELNNEIDGVERELIDNMVTEECESFKRNGSTFSLVIKEYPSAVQERKQELYNRMKEQGFEHLFTINTNTLSATVKELKSNNEDVLPDWLNGLIQTAEKASIRLRNN